MEWHELSNRFRKLSEKTGRNKSSSYDISVHIDGTNGECSVNLFTYDIADWPRHTNIGPFSCEDNAKIATLKTIEEAEIAVEQDS